MLPLGVAMVHPYKDDLLPQSLCQHRRQKAMARRLRRCRFTIATENERARWGWHLPGIPAEIGGPIWLQPPRLDRFCREFLGALKAGSFDSRGKTRLVSLNPQAPD